MNRRDFMHHAGWTGLGLLWTMTGSGLANSFRLGTPSAQAAERGSLSFVQISDSHIGFHQAANPDVTGTLARSVATINAMPVPPAFVIHTGDLTHLSKPDEFQKVKGLLAELKVPLLTIPGEHDVIGDDGRGYFSAFGRKDAPRGWYSWDQGGTHFVALQNVLDFGTKNMGVLGADQLAWLKRDLAPLASDTPVVVFSHIPLYPEYPQWGWATEDAPVAMALLKRFAAVTVLCGHIHQVIHHAEGAIRYATAASTAYPQVAPGRADHAGPLTLPADQLPMAIGIRQVTTAPGQQIVIADSTMATMAPLRR